MARPITVLHVLNGASGGAALSTIALMQSLRKAGIQPCAVCDDRGTNEERARLREAVGGNVLFTPLYWWNRKNRSAAWKRPLLELRQLLRTGWKVGSTRKIVQASRNWHADLIHTNTLLTPEGGLAARKIGIPHVWHVRELIGPGFPFQFGRVGRAFATYLIKQCDRVIANSQVTATQINEWLPKEFVSVIPNGIDCSAFVPRQLPAVGRPLIVAMVANLPSRWKKHHLFIEAAAQVDQSLQVEWRIYGHDPSEGGRLQTDAYINSLHALARNLKIDARFRYPGHVPPDQIMKEIDLLVHPTDVESFGRVVIEAMAAGIPVVGVNGGGVAEILSHGDIGLLARPNDPNDLARCTERVIRDREFAIRCATLGRKRAEQDYSIEATSSRVACVYEEVLHTFPGREDLMLKNAVEVPIN